MPDGGKGSFAGEFVVLLSVDMEQLKIEVIKLSAEEENLLKQISFTDLSHEVLKKSCSAAGDLAKLLIERDCIPRIRVEYFTNPEYNVGLRASRKETFEKNGTKGEDIFYHGNFLRYLRYFIFGPDLPRTVIIDFCENIESDDLLAFVRSQVRKHRLNPGKASEEFYKLALECGLPEWNARSIRDTVKNVR